MESKAEMQMALFGYVIKKPRSNIPRRRRILPLMQDFPASETSCVSDDSSVSVVTEKRMGGSNVEHSSSPHYNLSSYSLSTTEMGYVMKKPRSKMSRRRRIPPLMQDFSCGRTPKHSASETSDDSSADSVATEERIGSSNVEFFHRRSSINFLSSVKKIFARNPLTYVEFLRAVNGYNRGKETWSLCIKIVNLLFGHADIILQFVGFFDGKFREEVQRNCGFAIDDRLNEIEVMRLWLKGCIECVEEAQQLAPPEMVRFVGDEFEGYKLAVIKKLYGDRSVQMIEFLKKNPERALPVILERLRDEERAVSIIRSDALEFLGQFRVLNSKRGVKRKLRPD